MSYHVEFRHLKYFQMVADELSFRKAAVKLFISQPGLTRQIQQLEEIYGVELFARNKRNVMLTEAGKFLKVEVDFLSNHLDNIHAQLKNIAEGKLTEIKIGFLGSAGQSVVPELILKLNEKYSSIQTTLEEMSNQLQISLIEKHKLDLGFVRLPRVPEGISRYPIGEDTFSIVLPNSHHLNSDNFVSVKQLLGERFIFFSSEDSPHYHDLILSICEDAGFTPKVSHKSVHAPTIFNLVEKCLGIAIVPTSLKLGYNFKIKFIELKDIPQRTELSVIWKDTNRNPSLGNVISLIKELYN